MLARPCVREECAVLTTAAVGIMAVSEWRGYESMHDIAAFLRAHPPFNGLGDETLARVAESAEIEFFAARSPILASADAVAECGYVVRCGSVELVVDGRLPDLVGEGEVFGFASILSGDPLGFVARAAEDTLVYRIPTDEIGIQRAIEARLGLRAR